MITAQLVRPELPDIVSAYEKRSSGDDHAKWLIYWLLNEKGKLIFQLIIQLTNRLVFMDSSSFSALAESIDRKASRAFRESAGSPCRRDM